MSNITQAYINWLARQSAITDLVPVASIRDGSLAQTIDAPMIMVERPNTEAFRHQQAAAHIAMTELVVTVIGKQPSETENANDIAEAIREATDGYVAGGTFGATGNQYTFYSMNVTGISNGRTQPFDASDQEIPDATVQVQIGHSQSVPTFS